MKENYEHENYEHENYEHENYEHKGHCTVFAQVLNTPSKIYFNSSNF